MSTITAAPQSFMDSLTWVRCLFCLKQFSRNHLFIVFTCDAIACHDCSKRLYSRNNNRMNCVHCQKSVGFCPIREAMPEHVRKMFEPILNLGHEMVQIHNFQQRIRGLIQNRVREQVDRLKQQLNEQRHELQQVQRETERLRQDQHRQQVLKVIPEERLQHLLQYDEEQLRNMSFEQFKGRIPQQRSSRLTSRQHDTAPMEALNNSSTPTTFRSHGSSHSSSSRHTASEQRWTYNRGVTGHSFGNDQFGQNPHSSRDNPQNMRPVCDGYAQNRRQSRDRPLQKRRGSKEYNRDW